MGIPIRISAPFNELRDTKLTRTHATLPAIPLNTPATIRDYNPSECIVANGRHSMIGDKARFVPIPSPK